MDFFEVLEKRQSIRAFEEKKIEEEKIQKILKAANSAPSAGNLQAYEVFLTLEIKKKKALAQAAGSQEFIAQAPVVLVFCAHPEKSGSKYFERGKKLYALQDATIACAYAQLTATALELGSVWVGAFQKQEVLEILDTSLDLNPVSILPIGYPLESPEKKSRRDLDDLVTRI